jgi:hypothetical protein
MTSLYFWVGERKEKKKKLTNKKPHTIHQNAPHRKENNATKGY